MPEKDHKSCPRGHDPRWLVYAQREIAEALLVDPSTVSFWIRCGAPRTQVGSNRYEYCIPCLAQWVRSGKTISDLTGDSNESIWPERKLKAQTLRLERSLAEQEGQLVSVELFQEVMAAAFPHLRRFAEDQIRKHGTDAADSWREAVDEFGKAVELVIKPPHELLEAGS